jgi:hypothetical protein
MPLSGLAVASTYHYRVRSKDSAGNLAISGDFTFSTPAPQDMTHLVLADILSSSVSDSAATISLTTNEASNTQVE